ncbi:McrC family protein [Sphingomonas yabuuchiae]|uniref:McrC family protein n=1 Tax=Sphingomonas yabuuchiae TaxID=172044 RepID=UPI0025E385AF|nr:restriction endonuclease [uncultured Sphingomonas sp.]
MTPHRLWEWEGRGFDAEQAIPRADADRLIRAAQGPAGRLKGAQRAFDLFPDRVSARNLVGIVAAGDVSCEILPKIDREATPAHPASLRRQLISMLAVAHDLRIADDAATLLDTQQQTLLEILITRFVALAEDAVRRGMPRLYVAHADDLPALRGRLDPVRQFSALAGNPSRLACRYDVFSEDIALNQVMKAAILCLRLLARSMANQRRLGELALVYADVATVARSQLRWDRIVPDRANARWQPLLRLARLILGDQFQNTTAGSADGFALLFDMNVLFERYVARLLAPIADEAGWTLHAQGGRKPCLTGENAPKAGLFETEPDLRLERDGRVAMIVDTKWKCLADPAHEPKMCIDQADIYQVMAYARVYGCNRLMLLYPHHAGLGRAMPVDFTVTGSGAPITLTVATLDISDHATARQGLIDILGLYGR